MKNKYSVELAAIGQPYNPHLSLQESCPLYHVFCTRHVGTSRWGVVNMMKKTRLTDEPIHSEAVRNCLVEISRVDKNFEADESARPFIPWDGEKKS